MWRECLKSWGKGLKDDDGGKWDKWGYREGNYDWDLCWKMNGCIRMDI
jgi:hypothetical protein